MSQIFQKVTQTISSLSCHLSFSTAQPECRYSQYHELNPTCKMVSIASQIVIVLVNRTLTYRNIQ